MLKKLDENGSALLISMGLVALLGATIISTSSFFDLERKLNKGIEKNSEGRLIAQDIFATLNDSANCSLSVGRYFGEQKFNASIIPIQRINEVTNEPMFTYRNTFLYKENSEYNGMLIKTMSIKSVRPKEVVPQTSPKTYLPQEYVGIFEIKYARGEGSFGPTDIRYEEKIEIKTNGTRGRDFEKFLSCKIVGEKYDGLASESSGVPSDCPDGSLLAVAGNKFVCSTDNEVDYITVTNITRRTMPCFDAHARTGSISIFGERCATRNAAEFDYGVGGTKLFYPNGSRGTVNPLPFPGSTNSGITLDSFNYVAKSKSKVGIRAFIPVYFSQSRKHISPYVYTDANDRSNYDAAFLGFIFYKPSSADANAWQLAGVQEIWNPTSGPGGGYFYYRNASNTSDVVVSAPSRGFDMGGTGLVTGEFNAEAGTTYNVSVQVISLAFFMPWWSDETGGGLTSATTVANRPALLFGTMKFDHVYTEGSYILTEYMRK